MEPPNENQLTSYFHHHHNHNHNHNHLSTTASASPSNGLLPTSDSSLSVYPHSVPSAVASPPEPARRKRGRPRKYGTPEQALAAKKVTSSHSSSKERKEQPAFGASASSSSYSAHSRKSQLDALGNAGHGFTPHVISVAAGEDVAQKIMFFMQQSMREICVLSASGSISNASLRQPATSGGNITYEGRFDIISLSGSYVRTEIGGRTGGLSACLCSTDGQIIGGGVGGPLKAAGPVQVIVGTFMLDTKKDINAGLKGNTSANQLPSPVGEASVFRPTIESSGRNPMRGNGDHQTIGGSHFMLQPRGMHMTPSQPMDWRGGLDARETSGYDLTGRTSHLGGQSPENGDYDHIED